MIDQIEAWIASHPKLSVALVALIVAVVEALTGLTVEIANQMPIG